ncbi:MAG TPA: hypothetical protein VEA81_05330 [Burkholderiaceae bacterium]|nr:hypothetical protein [Burkholderiaceae bacterium]
MSARGRLGAAMLAAALAAGCGHGGDGVPVGPPVVGLGLLLTRVGPAAVQLEWDVDRRAAVYSVSRDGFPLADVQVPTLVDASLVPGGRYCWLVLGRDVYGSVISQTQVGCLTLL